MLDNTLVRAQKNLFTMVERLLDENLIGDEADETIKKAAAVDSLSRTIIANSLAMAKIADDLRSSPLLEQLPLISINQPPPAEPPVIADGRRKSLLNKSEAGV